MSTCPTCASVDVIGPNYHAPSNRFTYLCRTCGGRYDEPTDEPRRIAEHVAAVTPQYRERAREWLNAEHADMVEELATLLATISAECCP